MRAKTVMIITVSVKKLFLSICGQAVRAKNMTCVIFKASTKRNIILRNVFTIRFRWLFDVSADNN